MTSKGIDSKSYDLAAHFLSDYPGYLDSDYQSLAAVIQDAVEDWFFHSVIGPFPKPSSSERKSS